MAATPTISDLVTPFVSAVADGSVEVYNEFSLQHELGVFLRSTDPELKVQFERNVSAFFPDKTKFTKREIDISATSRTDKRLMFAIELKYPRNGQHPEQMFSFCKDIAFAEELVAAGFPRSAFIAFAEDPLFYRGPAEGIYGFFRGATPIHGRIQKPTGKRDAQVFIQGNYSVQWKPILGSLKYAVVEIGSDG